jgi:hypothetical protein
MLNLSTSRKEGGVTRADVLPLLARVKEMLSVKGEVDKKAAVDALTHTIKFLEEEKRERLARATARQKKIARSYAMRP